MMSAVPELRAPTFLLGLCVHDPCPGLLSIGLPELLQLHTPMFPQLEVIAYLLFKNEKYFRMSGVCWEPNHRADLTCHVKAFRFCPGRNGE